MSPKMFREVKIRMVGQELGHYYFKESGMSVESFSRFLEMVVSGHLCEWNPETGEMTVAMDPQTAKKLDSLGAFGDCNCDGCKTTKKEHNI